MPVAFLLALLLAPSLASAQGFIRYYPPASGSGSLSYPLNGGGTSCATPAFSFTDDTDAGVCLSAANAVVLQSGPPATVSTSHFVATNSTAYFDFYDASGADGQIRLGDNFADITVNQVVAAYFTPTATFFGSTGVNDRIGFTPVAKGGAQFDGTFTSADLTGSSKTWTMPDATGDVAVIASTGFPVRTAAQTWAARSLTSSDGSIVWSNADGVSGNPSAVVDSSVFMRYSSGTGTVSGTGSVGTCYAETDANLFSCYTSTNTPKTFAATAGATFTGTHDFSGAVLAGASPLAFDGSTAGTNKTTVAVTDPTGNRTLTIPNADSVTVQPQTCSGTDKVSAVSSLGVVTCSADTGGSGGRPLPNTKRITECGIGGSGGTSVWFCHGAGSGYVDGTHAAQAADASDGAMYQTATAASTNSANRISTGVDVFRGGRSLYMQGYVKLGSTASERFVIGFHDETSANATASADPAMNGAWFRYDSASDTNWQCVTNDDSGGGTISDSSVAVATSSFEFEIIETPSTNVVFKINGSTVCTNSANLPASTNMFASADVRTLENVSKSFKVGWLYVESDK